MTSITLDWLHLATLLGAVQGFVLSGVLATRHRNPTANRLLSVAVFAFSIHMLTVVYYAVGLERVYPHFFGVGYPLPLLYGPLVLLYSVTASDRNRRLRWRDALHFLPFVAVVVVMLPVFLLSGAEKLAFFQRLQQGDAPTLVRLVDPLKLVSGLAYSAATIIFLRRHQVRVKDSYSSLERVNLSWLLRLTAAAAAIWGLATVLHSLRGVDHPLVKHGDDLVALALAIMVYGIGYLGLRQPEIFSFAPEAIPAGPQPAAPPPASIPVDAVSPRYQRSGLTDREASALKAALLTAMDTKRPWQGSDLTLDDLARRLETTPHKLSEVLSTQLDQTFYDFVNGYRVRDVQRRIAADEAGRLTLLALALDAGFASKSTFNLAFKKHTGLTPSEYRNSLRQ
jgi:AraC-like DNA-binding protein